MLFAVKKSKIEAKTGSPKEKVHFINKKTVEICTVITNLYYLCSTINFNKNNFYNGRNYR